MGRREQYFRLEFPCAHVTQIDRYFEYALVLEYVWILILLVKYSRVEIDQIDTEIEPETETYESTLALYFWPLSCSSATYPSVPQNVES